MIRSVAEFRSKQRLPILSAYIPTNKKKIGFITLWRCSQPIVGVFKNRSPEDEYFIQMIGDPLKELTLEEYANGKTTVDTINCDVHLYDLRGKKAALGNKIAGKGFESRKFYTNIEVFFADIPNIHGVRDSYEALSALLHNPSSMHNGFHTKLGKTNWLSTISLILRCSKSILASLTKGYSVIVHCSDGWDRTAQVVSLVQLMIFPHYRTIEGFGSLVDKEFVAAGYKFDARNGLTPEEGNKAKNKESPVFIQFLDSVHQLWSQFPSEFEFNIQYLKEIGYFSYGGIYGNLIMSCHQERSKSNFKETTLSFWSYAKTNRERYINQFFNPRLDIIVPDTSESSLRLWKEMHGPQEGFLILPPEGFGVPYEQRLVDMLEGLTQENQVLKESIQNGLQLKKERSTMLEVADILVSQLEFNDLLAPETEITE